MSLISVSQINNVQLALAIQQSSSGAAFSGNFVSFVSATGYIGPVAVWTTGGAQSISGAKTFNNPVSVPYTGTTGQTVARLYVDIQDASVSGGLTGQIMSLVGGLSGVLTGQYATLTYVNSLSGIIASGAGGGGGSASGAVMLTGNQLITGIKTFVSSPQVLDVYNTAPGSPYYSDAVSIYTLNSVSGVIVAQIPVVGIPQDVVFTSGNQTISGVKTFTGNILIAAPTLPSGAVNLSYLLGVSGVLAGSAGAGAPNAVFQTGDQNISGQKIFTGSPLVAFPSLPSGATNILYVSGVSGALAALIAGGGGATNYYYITGTGVVNASSFASGNVVNTFSITSGTTNVINSGSAINTFNISGGTTNFNITGVTGNYVNMSFFFDSTTLVTGLNNIEGFISRNIFFTGYAVGAYTSGTQGNFSGSFYQRTTNNTKVTFQNFFLTSGMYFTGVGGLLQTLSGMNRIGVDIYSIGTGLTGLSLGVFGVGY